MVDIGDRVQVPSTRVGQPPRDGVVTGVSGPLLRVKWSGGEESSIVPAVGSMTVIGKVKAPSGRSRRAPGTPRSASVARRAARGAPGKAVRATTSSAMPPEKSAKPAKPAKSSTVPVKRRG